MHRKDNTDNTRSTLSTTTISIISIIIIIISISIIIIRCDKTHSRIQHEVMRNFTARRLQITNRNLAKKIRHPKEILGILLLVFLGHWKE